MLVGGLRQRHVAMWVALGLALVVPTVLRIGRLAR